MVNVACCDDRQQKLQIEKLQGYFEWAKNDSRIAGMCPWHFSSRFGNPQIAGMCDALLGVIEMPDVVGLLQQIGEYIVHNAAADPPSVPKEK